MYDGGIGLTFFLVRLKLLRDAVVPGLPGPAPVVKARAVKVRCLEYNHGDATTENSLGCCLMFVARRAPLAAKAAKAAAHYPCLQA